MSTLTNELGLVPLAIDPGLNIDGTAPAFGTTGLIDASTEKYAVLGSVWHPTVKTGTINIRKVHFRAGAVTLNAASELRVSLQNVSLTAGPPYQPDGTQDQFYDFKTATTAVTANAWNTTGALSADRAVSLSADSLGDANSRWVAVVFEYQVFTAADSVIISNANAVGTGFWGAGAASLLNTGSYAVLGNRATVVALECDDGTFAFILGATVFSAFSNASVSSVAAIRRAGLKFKFPTQRKIDRASIMISVANGSDGRFVLYDSDGTTELVSVDLDNDAVYAQGAPRFFEVTFEPVTLSANTYYRWVFVGGTATASTVNYGDVNAAGLMDGLIGGQNMHWTQHDGASWTDTTTRRPHFAIGTSAIHDGVGAYKPVLRRA